MPERPIVTTRTSAVRGYVWEAIREGWDASQPAGYGSTEADAIADLRAQEAVAKLNRAVAQIKRTANTVMLSPVAMSAAFMVGTCLAGWIQ